MHVQVFTGHSGPVRCGRFTPDGKLVVTGGGEFDASLRVWDPKTGTCVRTMQGQQFHPTGVLVQARSTAQCTVHMLCLLVRTSACVSPTPLVGQSVEVPQWAGILICSGALQVLRRLMYTLTHPSCSPELKMAQPVSPTSRQADSLAG